MTFALRLGLVLAALVVLGGCGENYDELTIEWYCGYGAQSRAQFRTCVDHVTIDDVHASAARGRGAGEWAMYCLDNYTSEDFDAGLVRECNALRRWGDR
jgi:hypothetical protein